MHSRIAAFLAGCWVLGSLFMLFVATENFKAVDRVLASSPQRAAAMLETLGPDDSRSLLRYLASEENRFYFQTWEIAQLVLGVALTGFLLFGMNSRLLAGLAGAMVILAAFQHFTLTPEMISWGRLIDFQRPAVPTHARDMFWRLHGLYGGIEVVKLLMALVIAGLLLAGSRRSNALEAADYVHHQ